MHQLAVVCADLRDTYGVTPYKAWGKLPVALRSTWEKQHCDYFAISAADDTLCKPTSAPTPAPTPVPTPAVPTPHYNWGVITASPTPMPTAEPVERWAPHESSRHFELKGDDTMDGILDGIKDRQKMGGLQIKDRVVARTKPRRNSTSGIDWDSDTFATPTHNRGSKHVVGATPENAEAHSWTEHTREKETERTGSPTTTPPTAPPTERGQKECGLENNGRCDVPSRCPLGTDIEDCKGTSIEDVDGPLDDVKAQAHPKENTRQALCKNSTCSGGMDSDGYLSQPTVHHVATEYLYDCGWDGKACVCYCWVKPCNHSLASPTQAPTKLVSLLTSFFSLAPTPHTASPTPAPSPVPTPYTLPSCPPGRFGSDVGTAAEACVACPGGKYVSNKTAHTHMSKR